MWEHVPLAWALIILATSESTQELLAEKEIFHKVKSPRGSLGPGSFVLNVGPLQSLEKSKLRWIQASSLLKKRRIISTKSIHHGSTCSAYRTLTASFNIHKRKGSTNVQYQQDAYWSWASEHKYKSWMFGAFIHVSEMTNNEAVARSIPTFSLQLNSQPLEELPECAFLLLHLLDKYFGWSKHRKAACRTFGVQV